MTHPTPQQLHAWLDGETAGDGVDAEVTASHVSSCAQCAQAVASVRELGLALRMWADDIAPNADGDLADRVMRASAAAPAATAVSGSNGAHGASSLNAPVAHSASATRLSSGRARSRWTRVGVSSGVALAVAAIALLAVRQGRDVRGPRVTGSSLSARNMPKVPAARGTEVIAIQPADERTTYSVMEIPGEVEGIVNSVVWIEDQPDDDQGAVPSAGTP